MAWMAVKNPGQDVIHIIPLRDFEAHDESGDCRCGPSVESVEGGGCDLLIHEPYDDALLGGGVAAKDAFSS